MDRILKRLDSVHAKLLATVNSLDNSHFKWRPKQNAWCVAEILHHLCLVEERVVADLEKSLASEPRRVGFFRRMMPISIVGFRLVRVKAPKAVTPLHSPEKEDALKAYEAARAKTKQLCRAQGKARLRNVVFKHPFLGEIDGVAAVALLGHHELRHFKQIRDVLKQVN